MNTNLVPQIIRQSFPAFYPTYTSQELSRWVEQLEKLFRQPIKSIFPYPMDIKKKIDPTNRKLKEIQFDFALAGISKEEIKVQLKNHGKLLTVRINKNLSLQDQGTEYVSNGISYRNGEVTFRIIPDIDITKFKPTYKDGLLVIKLYTKENQQQDDIITAQL